jgi:hypothetical protein
VHNSALALAQVCQPCVAQKEERYFAIVIKADAAIGQGLLSMSAHLGNFVGEMLPDGVTLTRSIEITKDLATRAW